MNSFMICIYGIHHVYMYVNVHYKAQADLTSDQLRRLGNEQYDDMRLRH
jgi:hypothetical protein